MYKLEVLTATTFRAPMKNRRCTRGDKDAVLCTVVLTTYLPLIPVCRTVHVVQGRHRRQLVRVRLDTDERVEPQRPQVVHDLEEHKMTTTT